MSKTNKNSGFTIIEVVLVLAIAGLIFLMVFIALPALQRSQRDTARKQDASAVASAITNYTSNNRGQFPTSLTPGSGYLDNVSSNTTSVSIPTGSNPASVTPADGIAYVYKGVTCGTVDPSTPGTVPLTSAAARQFVVVVRLEGGGGTAFCQGN